MTTKTEEISAAVKTTGEAITEAAAHAERLAESARDKAETAAEHGWGGVAANMEQAVEHLEGVIEQLRKAEQAGQPAATVLDEITDQMSSPEVVEHLVTAGAELDTVHGSLEAAIAQVDEAIAACEAAGQTSLPGAIHNLREEITAAHEQAGQSHADTDAERQHAENWTNEVEEEAGAS
jgi:prefoldin subunit 5